MVTHVKNYLRHFDIGETDNWFCEGCLKEDHIQNFEIHHIIYRSHGGGDEVENCVCLCKKHHKAVHDCNISQSEVKLIHNSFLLGHRKKYLK
jgi:predicted restriction endonuclease